MKETDELRALLILSTITRLYKKYIINLIEHQVSLAEFINHPNNYQHLCPLSDNMKQQLSQLIADKTDPSLVVFRWLNASQKHHIIPYYDPLYPATLKNIHDPPLLLYLIGNPQALSLPQMAVIGTRKPSAYGKTNTDHFTKELCQYGLAITSGLAYGIDVLAHKAALDNQGQTIAVMGTGIDLIYPRENRSVARDIIDNGAVISEFPLGTKPARYNFPKRNRIISGLSCGTLIVESALKSGSLITAKHALDQGREVFAIPGNIHHGESAGCHALIQQGAKLVTNIDDIINEIQPVLQPVETVIEQKPPAQENLLLETLSENQQKILTLIDYHVTALDSIINATNMAASEVPLTLFELEMQGLIENIPGGYRRL